MTTYLGFQELNLCAPHGVKPAVVVRIDGNCLVAFGPDLGPLPSTAGWVYLTTSKKGDEYYFGARNELSKYNINWNILEPQEINENCIGKLTLCVFESNMTPLIIEVLSVESGQNKLKLKFPKQTVYDMEKNELIELGPLINYVKITKDKGEYVTTFEEL
jgi:hypothetical protein